MTDIKYFEPKSVKEVISLLSIHKDEAKILAGGTALLVLLKQKIFIPQCLINIKRIENLENLTSDDGKGIIVGALNRLSDMEFSPVIGKNCASLIEGIKSVGSPIIRNVATIGGNICHGDPASGLILQLMAMDAKLKLIGSEGERWVGINEFYVDFFETTIRFNEILTEVRIPFLLPGSGNAYLGHCMRKALDRPIISVAVTVTLIPNDFTCRRIRVVLGGIAKTPVRAKGAEEVASGKWLDLKAIEEVADAAYEGASPGGDMFASAEYKREMVRVFVKRATRLAVERAKAAN